MSAALDAAREAVIKAAVQIVYDGMSDAAWHRIKRAVLAMEAVAPRPICPAEYGGKMQDCPAYPACACDSRPAR